MSLFTSKREVKLFVCEKSVQLMKPFGLDKSEPSRFVVSCTKEGCGFRMSFHGNDKGVYLLVEERQHTCTAALPTIKRMWIRQKAVEMSVDRKVTPTTLKDFIKEKYQIDVGLILIRNSLADSKKAVLKDNTPFGLVTSFLGALAQNNDGTKTSIMSNDGVFQRAFLCPGMCVNAFWHTPKIVGLDACHIKAPYGGALLVMTVLDGNGSIFPAAVGIAESENTATWSWFLRLVQAALHVFNGGEGIVFMSDREKGIENSLREVFPRAVHGFCVFHIQKNVKKEHQTSLDGLLFQAAKAATDVEFNEKIALMRSMHEDATAYILAIDKTKWARAFFPVRRLGHVTSNIAESMNKWLDDARYQDPVGLFSTFIMKLNVVFEKRRNIYASMGSASLPKRVADLLAKSVEDSRKLDVRRHTATLFEVQTSRGRN